ncbi:MAG TPA: 2-phosphosulfolactate phosphatase [Bacteroidales bacterium]|nr:2-phosphosulfolactate phosphatase [Bacteroidales bacterium]
MRIEIVEFVEGARKAEGLAVIIDVFRAFSVECYAYDAGAVQIIATSEVEEAFRLKNQYSNSILVGERDEKKIPGFDIGNSPTEIIKTNLSGKTVIHTTTAGTQGLINAEKADTIITGSFVNAGAVVRYIRHLDPEVVYLVAMGYRASVTSEEDILCAELISERLKGGSSINDKTIASLKHTSGKRFFNIENINFSPPTDFFLCTMTDRFSFVLEALRRPDGNVSIIKKDI